MSRPQTAPMLEVRCLAKEGGIYTDRRVKFSSRAAHSDPRSGVFQNLGGSAARF